MPTPTIPNRTVSLGGTRPARSDVGARDAPTAAPLSSRNSRRDQVVFMATSISHVLALGQVRAASNADRPRPPPAPAWPQPDAPPTLSRPPPPPSPPARPG